MFLLRRQWPIVVLVLSAMWVYRDVLAGLFHDWTHDDNYSHGLLIVPLAAYFAWERRAQLMSEARRPSVLGLVIVLGSLALLVAGILGAEFFLSRLSVLGLLAGSVLFLFGPQHLRLLAFPIGFLLLMIPIPAIIFNQIAFPLQIIASKFGVAVMELLQVPVLREGNVIVLAATTLEVAEACSGIRSLISLVTLGVVYGYFTDKRWWLRATVAAVTIPIAIIANGLRVAGTGVLAHHYGVEAALGFFHTFSGWLVFLFAFCLLFVVVAALQRLWPQPISTFSPIGVRA